MQFDHVAMQVDDIAAAITWWRRTVPDAEVLYQDESWGFLRAGGVKLAFVLAHQHPVHTAWEVSVEELERLAGEHGAAISAHRDGSRSFYVEAPGGTSVELIAYAAEPAAEPSST
ncbi:MAG: hypothetical protein QOJ38_1833 [Solirubrobacterales bacterium]|nr:hypothetical protein [Solirubrobacterales bacterium]